MKLHAVLFIAGLCLGCGSSPTAPAAALALSPDQTALNSTSGQIVDAQLNVWTLGAGKAVLENGKQVLSADFGGSLWKGYATKLLYDNGLVYALGQDDGRWWWWDGTRFELWVSSVVVPR